MASVSCALRRGKRAAYCVVPDIVEMIGCWMKCQTMMQAERSVLELSFVRNDAGRF